VTGSGCCAAVSTATAERALDALRMAESDPRRSVALAEEVSRAALVARDPAAASTAERAWGLAAYHLEDIDLAVRRLRRAVRLGQQARVPHLVAEARMTLAAVLNWHGQPRAALRQSALALTGLTGVQRARAEAQRGAILHLLGRLDEAMDCYRAALPVLRRGGDLLWVQRVLKNRGVAHTQRCEFGAAEADLRKAEQLCRRLDLDLSLGLVHQDLGFVKARRGDVPAAMAYLDQAEARFRALNSRLGRLLCDRAELLLSVRLISEARRAAGEAVHALEREAAKGPALPEARLLLAQSALLDGDLPSAHQQASLAMREFARHDREEWAALARLTVLSCRSRDETRRRRVSIQELDRTADRLADTWPASAMEARLTAAQLALERGQLDRGRNLLDQVSRRRRRGVATQRARAWYAEALRRQIDGNRHGACTAALAGLRTLNELVAGLGATDLRAHAAGHRADLAGLGLRIAIQDHRPERVFAWAELGRASHLSYPPAHPPDDPMLARAVAELRSTAAEIDQLRAHGRADTRLVQQQLLLERHIRDHYRRLPGEQAAAHQSPKTDTIAEALADAALVEFVQLDGSLRVLTIVDGQVRLRLLGPVTELADLAGMVPFALRRLARRHITNRSRSAAMTLLRDTASKLDAALLAAVPEIGDRSLVIVPTGQLQSLPWSILPSCQGRAVTIAPSATLWYAAVNRRPSSGRVMVAAGPGLAGAQAEAAEVATIHAVTALTGPAATVRAVADALDGAALAHLATHGRVSMDNPLFSSLRFADGPLMVHDLATLDRAPHTVVLAACDTGRSVVRTGDELLGLAATLLAHGTSHLVAPVLGVLDIETAPLMIAFHRLLATGRPVAAALADVQQQLAREHPTAWTDVAPFVCLGAGLTTPELSAPAQAEEQELYQRRTQRP